MTPEKQNRLDGKFALVTGASKGIGRAAALELAQMGASVAVNYNSSRDAAIETEKAIKNYGVDGFAVRADVGKLDDVNSMIDMVNDRFGQIDILVNNAGIIDDGLLLRMTDEAWKNVGSVVGLRGNVGQTNYTASKAGIIGFTYALAKEVATRNITVNTVTPGYVNTQTVEGLTQKQKDMIMAWIPMQRFGEVDDIAGMIGYLASPRASYVTGQIISVDGGMAI